MPTLSLLTTCLLIAAPAAAKPTLVVAPLRALGATKAEAALITEEVRTKAGRAGRYTVVSPQDIAAIEKELEAQLAAGCDATACMAELGGALGAQFLIAGSLGKLGKRFVLTLKLVDLEKVRAVRTANQRASSIKALVDELETAVFELMGVATVTGATGSTLVSGSTGSLFAPEIPVLGGSAAFSIALSSADVVSTFGVASTFAVSTFGSGVFFSSSAVARRRLPGGRYTNAFAGGSMR